MQINKSLMFLKNKMKREIEEIDQKRNEIVMKYTYITKQCYDMQEIPTDERFTLHYYTGQIDKLKDLIHYIDNN